MNKKKVTVVIPTYNSASKLQRLLNSIEKLKGLLPYEVIVVDDASSDNTKKVIKKWGNKTKSFRVIYFSSDANNGPGKARNIGLKLAKGNIVTFTDSDCVVNKRWLYNLTRKLNFAKGVVGVGGKVLPINPNGLISKYNTFHRVLEPPESLLYLVTANCCYYRSVVLNVGGFDEEIKKPGGEDITLSIKLWNKGYRFAYEPKAIVYHDYKETIKDFFQTFRNYGFGCSYATVKYMGESE